MEQMKITIRTPIKTPDSSNKINEHNTCWICSSVASNKNIVYETKNFMIFDIKSSIYNIHYVITTKDHIKQTELLTVDLTELRDILSLFFKNGYRIIMNVGENAGQKEEHLHFHIFGGCKLRDLGI